MALSWVLGIPCKQGQFRPCSQDIRIPGEAKTRAALKSSNLSWKFVGCVTWASPGPPGARQEQRGTCCLGQSHLLPTVFLPTHSLGLHPGSLSGGQFLTVCWALPFHFQGKIGWKYLWPPPTSSLAGPQESYLPAPSLWHQLMTWSGNPGCVLSNLNKFYLSSLLPRLGTDIAI